MKCKDCTRKLSAYLDGEMDPDQKKMMDQHLQTCPECQGTFDEMKSSWDLIQILPDTGEAPYFYTRLRARIKSEEKATSQTKWTRRLFYPLTTAVVLVFGMVVGTIVGMNGELTNEESDLEQEIASVFTLDSFDDFPSTSLSKIYIELSDSEQE